MDATTLFEKREEGEGQGELISLEVRRSSTTSTSTATSASKSNSRDVEQSEPLIYRGPGAGGETGLDNGTEAGHGGDADLDLEALKEAVGRRRESEDQGQPTKVSPWIMIPLWLTLSSSVIILNKHIFTSLHFPYPVFLTAFHMAVATAGTQVLRYTTNLMDQMNHQRVSFQTYTTAILPLGVLFSASLVLSNTAYVYLSVSFVQMLKAFIPVVVHLMSYAIGLAEMDTTIAIILGMISTGCVIAALGELKFSMFGFVCQVLAVVVESARLVAVQLMIGNRKLSPLVLVYLVAPLCFVMIAFLQPLMEGSAAYDDLPNVGVPILALSGGLAFALNVAGVYLIHSAGSLVLTLSGVLKDIILIVMSVIVLHSVMTTTQILGYGIALVGLVWFKQKGTGSPLTNLKIWVDEKFGEERRARYLPWL